MRGGAWGHGGMGAWATAWISPPNAASSDAESMLPENAKHDGGAFDTAGVSVRGVVVPWLFPALQTQSKWEGTPGRLPPPSWLSSSGWLQYSIYRVSGLVQDLSFRTPAPGSAMLSTVTVMKRPNGTIQMQRKKKPRRWP